MSAKNETALWRCAGGVEYEFTRRRVKNINLRLRPDGTVAVSASRYTPLSEVDRFVASRAGWVEAHRAALLLRTENAAPLPDKAAALAHFTALSETVFPAFSAFLGGKMPTIRVRAMRTRWGVCQIEKKQITYALQLYNMPPEAQIYVVVHEYCHFLVPNHSPAFWREVEQLLPDWKARRRLLRQPAAAPVPPPGQAVTNA